jgi:hypothetical protein
MAILLVGDLDFGTKGQRFVRRRHDVVVERDAVAVLVPGCDESPTAYTDATQSSARTGMLSKHNMTAAINHRMRDPPMLDAPRGELKVTASQRDAVERRRF